MSTPLYMAIFFTMWWTVLFAILPLGVRSQREEGERRSGTDPGAPVDPQLGRKALLTTLVTAVLFALFWLYVNYA